MNELADENTEAKKGKETELDGVFQAIPDEQPEEKVTERQMEKSIKTFLIVLGILVVLFIGFFIGWRAYQDKQNKQEFVYNGFTFQKDGAKWVTQWKAKDQQLYNLIMRYGPQEVENVTITGWTGDSFNYADVYITFDPEAQNLTYVSLAAADLAQNMAGPLGYNPIGACTKNVTEACASRPTIDCTSNASVIVLQEGGESKVQLADNCVLVQVEGLGLMKAAYKLLYIWYGIIK